MFPAHLNVVLLCHFKNCWVHSQSYYNQLFFTAKKHLHFATHNYASLYFPPHTQIFLPISSRKILENLKRTIKIHSSSVQSVIKSPVFLHLRRPLTCLLFSNHLNMHILCTEILILSIVFNSYDC